MKASHGLSAASQVFDEPNLVSHGGLLTAAVLCERVGLWPLVASTLTVPGPTGANSAAKVASVVAGILAGADSIDDLDVLRSGASPELFDQVRAPSTVGSWLRAFRPRQRPPARRGQPGAAHPVVGCRRRAAPPR